MLVALAVGLLITTGLVYWQRRNASAAPSDEYISFYCPHCDYSFQITHREFERRWNAGECRGAPGGGRLVIRCAKCGEYRAERAVARRGE